MPDSIIAATEHLEKTEGYKCIDILGKGTYGSVYKIVSENDQSIKAAKIVENRVLNVLEVREWPKLDHQNILKLIETVSKVDGVVIFITEIMDSNLFALLQEKDFRKDPQAPEKCRHFARQIFSGVAYLHAHKLCHLDLRAENIFVASRDRAVVADFSGLTYADELKKFCPLPNSLRPPEMLLVKRNRVAPMPVDLWACGLLLSYMFMGRGYYVVTVKNPKAGHIDAVSQYTEFFADKKYVRQSMMAAYPNCQEPPNRLYELVHLIGSFLEINPKNRISAASALEHSFLRIKVTEIPVIESVSDMKEVTSSSRMEKSTSTHSTEVRTEIKSQTKDLELEESNETIQKKRSMWTKYRPSFHNIRKLYASSPPLFKPRSSRRNKTIGSRDTTSQIAQPIKITE